MQQYDNCPQCFGSGFQTIETASLFGLVKKQHSIQCSYCSGTGRVKKRVKCSICDGQGLYGGTSEVCPTCNGTGYGDGFSLVPRSKLHPGTTFNRVCARCQIKTVHEVKTDIQALRTTVSWEADEADRKVLLTEQVRVACTACGDSYYVKLDPNFHEEGDYQEPALPAPAEAGW